MRGSHLVLVACIGAGSAAFAADEPASDDRIRQLEQKLAEIQRTYEQRIATLEAEVSALKNAGLPPQTPAPSPPPEAPSAPPVAPSTAQGSNYFNPQISVIGNFLAAAGPDDVEGLPAADLREAELGLRAVVDPYARADFFFAFQEEGVEIEEALVTFTALPWKLLSKVGRMRVSFGKINTLHLHTLPWPDEPLPIAELLGPEGWIGTGASVGRLIPLGNVYTELTAQVFRGDAEDLFAAPSRGDLAYNAHYRVFHDLSESTNLDVGLSYALGPNGVTDASDTTLEGVDVTLRWKPLRTATYRSATLRAEYMRSLREDPLGDQDADGWFVGFEYQPAKRWTVGARYERSERALDAALEDRGQALLGTFWPSEFLQLRGELRRRDYAEGITADEFLMQVQFAIGAHGAHPF